MFESNNEVVKVWAQGKLTSVKVRLMPNKKKKRPTDPDYVVKAVVDVATFDKNTGKQIDCISNYLDMDEFYVFIEALQMYGRKAMHIKVSGGNKMPAAELFRKNGGTEYNGNIIARQLCVTNGGPDKNADFFISADEAPGYKNDKGLFVKNKGARSIKWISMSLSSEQALAIANGCQSAVSIMNMWSAMGTLWKNLDRITPKSKTDNDNAQGNNYDLVQPRQQVPERQNSGYAAVPQGRYQNQGYAAQQFQSAGCRW